MRTFSQQGSKIGIVSRLEILKLPEPPKPVTSHIVPWSRGYRGWCGMLLGPSGQPAAPRVMEFGLKIMWSESSMGIWFLCLSKLRHTPTGMHRCTITLCIFSNPGMLRITWGFSEPHVRSSRVSAGLGRRQRAVPGEWSGLRGCTSRRSKLGSFGCANRGSCINLIEFLIGIWRWTISSVHISCSIAAGTAENVSRLFADICLVYRYLGESLTRSLHIGAQIPLWAANTVVSH